MRLARASIRAPRATLLFFLLAAVPLTSVLPLINWVNNPNENVRVYTTMALVEDHSFRIDNLVLRYGYVNDMARVVDAQANDVRHYSVKAPATSYSGVPLYWLLTKIAPRFGHPVPTIATPPLDREWWLRTSIAVMRLGAVQVPCLLFLVWFERWLRGTTRDAVLRLTAVAAAGLGTNYLAYALMFASHATFACAAFASFALTCRERERFAVARKRRKSIAFLAGFFAGLATLLEYHALPVSIVLALYATSAFWRPSRLAWLALGGAIDVAALMVFQWRAFGNPLTPGHKLSENPVFQHNLSQGVYGIEKPSWQVFKDISLSHAFGFFGMSPFMWLGLLAIPFALLFASGGRRARRERRWATVVWLVAMTALWVTVSAANNWRGGWTVGPRYLGAAPPFFAFGAVCALERLSGASRIRRTIARGVAGGLAIAGVLVSGVVGMHFNTLPDDGITRPLAQFTIPLARAGFVPHHAAEILGWNASTFWYVAAACLVAAALAASLWPKRDAWWTWAMRLGLVAAFAFVGVRPAFGAPQPDEGGDAGVHEVHDFAHGWDPPDRDRIHRLREDAERYGPRRPCLWYKLADVERIVQWNVEADADEKRAGVPRSQCK